MNTQSVFALNNYIIMDKNESIEQVLEGLDNNIVYKTRKSPLQAIVLILLGIGVFIANSLMVSKVSSAIPSLLIMLGSIFIISGILVFVFRKMYYVSADNHQKLHNHEVFFEYNDRDKLVRLIETGNLKEIKSFQPIGKDGLKLRVMSTEDKQICLFQLIAYIPYEYVNVTPAKQSTVEEAQILKEIIQHSHKLN